jgi:hypothetical protein
VLDPVVLIYAGFVGGRGFDAGFAIAADGANNAYVVGRTDSTEATFPAAAGPDLTFNGGAAFDAFVARVQPAGTGLAYAGYIGGANRDEGKGIAVDGSGHAYVAGLSESTVGFLVTRGPGLTHNGSGDAFVAKLVPIADFFLRSSGPNNNPPTVTLFLDPAAPTATTAKFRDSTGVHFSSGNPWKDVGTWAAEPSLTVGELSYLRNLHAWLGLKNSDDQGTQFDLRAEVHKNGALVASGLTRCITGVTRNAAQAREVMVAFDPFAPVTFNGTTDVLSLKVLTRIGTNLDGSKCPGPGGSHSNAAGLRLYFDAIGRPARFDATID